MGKDAGKKGQSWTNQREEMKLNMTLKARGWRYLWPFRSPLLWAQRLFHFSRKLVGPSFILLLPLPTTLAIFFYPWRKDERRKIG